MSLKDQTVVENVDITRTNIHNEKSIRFHRKDLSFPVFSKFQSTSQLLVSVCARHRIIFTNLVII